MNAAVSYQAKPPYGGSDGESVKYLMFTELNNYRCLQMLFVIDSVIM